MKVLERLNVLLDKAYVFDEINREIRRLKEETKKKNVFTGEIGIIYNNFPELFYKKIKDVI